MPLARLLLISFALLGAVAVVLLRGATLRRVILRPRVLSALLASSVSLSAVSAVVRSSGASGTGTRTSHGFPKPFYFTWTSWEGTVSTAGFEWLYFAGNWIGWLAALSVAALLYAVARV